MNGPARLDVYYGAEPVGTLVDDTPLAFEYAPAWLARDERLTVGLVPLQPGPQQGPAVQAFFENLLPEGELRQFLAQQRQASSVFSLLRAVAGDTAGAFTIVPAGQPPAPPHYTATSWPAIAAVLARASASAIDLQGPGARISLAGAQDKAGLAIFDDGVPRLPGGTSPSTHILKPDIRRLAKVWHSAANETIVMRTAAHCGLPTAEVFYEPTTRACVVRRFDRAARPDGTLARRVQYDLCQLAGTLSARKYEREGGPSLADCAALIRRYSTQPAPDLRHFVGWLCFNLFVGNDDAHAKNLSLYHVPGRGVALTPFYDLMCTRLYPGLSPEMAMAVGGAWRPGEVTRERLDAQARALGMQPRFVAAQAAALAQRLPAALARAVDETLPLLSPSARTLAARLQQFVASTTRKAAARLAG